MHKHYDEYWEWRGDLLKTKVFGLLIKKPRVNTHSRVETRIAILFRSICLVDVLNGCLTIPE
ncbi:MAG: hypothetical protein Q9172_007046 [Xanthocarpia lactea]